MKNVTYCVSSLDALLKRVPQWTDRLSKQLGHTNRPEADRIYLVGAGAGFAAALAVKKEFALTPGLSGEDVCVVTPAHLRLSVPKREKENALAIVFGSTQALCCKEELHIAENGELSIESGNLLETYVQMCIAGLLLTASFRYETGMEEKITQSARMALAVLPAWEQETAAAASQISGHVDAYETIGTGSDYAAAWISRMLLYALAPAAVTTVEESEDWLHVNFLQLTPERFATLVFLSSENEAADRTQRTLGYIEGVGRKTVIFTDLPHSKLDVQSPVVSMPSMAQALLPVFLPLPAALLISALH